MLLPRKWTKVRQTRAIARGYFWLPCPCCGQDFGGNEVGQRYINEGDRSKSCCRWCDDCEGSKREQQHLSQLFGQLFGVAIPEGYLISSPTYRCDT